MYFWHKNKTATVECIEQGNEIVIHYHKTHSNLEDKEKLGLDAKKERNCKHQNVWTKLALRSLKKKETKMQHKFKS